MHIQRQIQRQRQRTPSKSNPKDLWPLIHLIRVMRRYDLTQKDLHTYIQCHTYTPTYLPTFVPPLENILKERSLGLVTFETFDQSDEKIWPDPKRPTYLHTYPPIYLPTYLITHWATFGFLTFVDRNFFIYFVDRINLSTNMLFNAKIKRPLSEWSVTRSPIELSVDS